MQIVATATASRKPMTMVLTPEQSALYDEGGYAQWRLEETLIEDLDRQHITAPVVVTLDTGEILFAITHGQIA